MNSKNLLKIAGGIALTGILLVGCKEDNTGKDPKGDKKPADSTKVEKPDNTAPSVGVYDNAIFSIPSPIQLSGIIQKSGAAYDAELVNGPEKSDRYTTVTQQSLNLGIYGADLGYTTMYDNQQEALKFMRAAQKLATTLGISDAFDAESLSQIERNLDNKDSLLYLVSNSYRKADDYLQSADRKHIGALIIVGGWIESLHFAGQLGKTNKDPEIRKVIGQQKTTLETILTKMLVKHYGQPGVEDVYNQLSDLQVLFDKVEIKYEYVKPIHNTQDKITTIKSKSTVEISEETFNSIADKIELLRNQIIQ